MKILIVNMYYYPNLIGGAEHSIKLLAENLVNNGIEVHIYTLDGDRKINILNDENINGVMIHRGYSKSIYRRRILKEKYIIDKIYNGIHSIYNFQAVRDIEILINTINPDIIHTNNTVSISYGVWKIAKRANVKIVHTLRDYWLLDPTTVLGKSNKLFTVLFRKYTRYMAGKYPDIVTAPSKYVLKVFRNYNYFLNKETIVIPNSIKINHSLLNSYYKIKSERNSPDVKFMFAGYLTSEKGIKELISTFMEIKNNIHLIICGNGPLRDYVKEKAMEDIRIEYRGELIRNELNKAYAEADVLIVPSMWDEPFGRIVIEGAQFLLPTIGSNRGGIPEIIRQLSAGKIINPANKSELRSAILEYSDRFIIKENFKAISDNIDIYDIEWQIQKFMKCYEELLYAN